MHAAHARAQRFLNATFVVRSEPDAKMSNVTSTVGPHPPALFLHPPARPPPAACRQVLLQSTGGSLTRALVRQLDEVGELTCQVSPEISPLGSPSR